MKIDYFTLVAINLVVALDCFRFHDYDLVENDMRSGFIAGDYVIGALFPIYSRFDDEDFQCSIINEYDGIQIAEAAFFAVDLINRNEDVLPNVTLGIDIKDYCNSIEVAVLQSKKLIDKSVSRSNETEDIFSLAQKGIESPLIGIIGPEDGVISLEVQSVLKFFAIVQVGYAEPLTDFVNDQMDLYPYFFSVTPGNLYMTEAIFDILIANNWTYVSIVHSTNSFELKGFGQFVNSAPEKGVCIADVIEDLEIAKLAEEYADAGDEYSKHMRDIMPSYDKVDVIVCYCSPQLTNQLFYLIKDGGYSVKRFVVIGGDGWPPRHPHEREFQDVAVGEILVSLEQVYIKEFDDYFSSLDLNTNKRNPWFGEFWQNHFKCEIDPYEGSEKPECTGYQTLADGYKQNPKVSYVIESVFVLAHALDNMLKNGCEDVHSGKLPMKNAFYKSCFQSYFQDVKFDFYGKSVQFDYNRIPKTIKYNFYNFQPFENGSYDYVQVGEYTRTGIYGDKNTILNRDLVFPENKTYVKSSCGEPCSPNHAKVLKKDKCCWDCVLCKPLEILVDSTRCEECENGFKSNSDKTRCIPIPMAHVKWHDAQILVSLLFSSSSIILTVFTFYVFFKNEHTPVVKSSSKELCYVMFVGMIFANLVPFSIIPVPNVVNCVIVRILPPITFTLIYAALLVKTNRIARILAISKKKFPNLNLKFLSLKAQIVFTALLISIEIFICSYSLFKYPMEPVNIFRQNDNSYYGMKICPLREDMMFEIFAFVGVLILICTYYAVKTRNLPENFNEAKYIGFAMYATILTDISFGLIYFGSEVKILAINLCISVNTLIVFIFLFAPKLYVILRMPEKNSRAYFITTTNIRCFIANYQESNVREPGSSKKRHEDEGGISLDTTISEINSK